MLKSTDPRDPALLLRMWVLRSAVPGAAKNQEELLLEKVVHLERWVKLQGKVGQLSRRGLGKKLTPGNR